MNEIKFFDTQMNSKSVKFSMQPSIPTINNVPQPMQLLFCIENENGKTSVLDFNKDQANDLLKELQRLVPLVNCFG
jgi:hypothetical protein